MKTRLSRIILIAALAAITAGCGPGTPTPTPRPSATPAPPTHTPSPTPATVSQRINQGVDGVMNAFMKGQAMTACSVVVVAPDLGPETPTPALGQPVTLVRQVHSFGRLGADNAAPVDQDTEYEIGGLSKLFTALVLSVENFDGLMPIGDPVQKFMPPGLTYPEALTYTTPLEDLALHTAGLPRHAQGMGGERRVDGVYQQGYASDDEMSSFLANFTQIRPPGLSWEYSNVGYGLLGMAEDVALADSWERVEVAIVSRPMGLDHTHVTPAVGELPHLALGYDAPGHPAMAFTQRGDLLAASGMRSTPSDLGLFLQAMIAPDQSRYPQAIQLTRSPFAATPYPGISQGLGWLIYHPNQPDEVFYKAGLTAGFSSYIAYSAVHWTGYAVMCNAPKICPVR